MKDKSLGAKAREGLSWNFAGNLFRQGFTIIVSILISRILGPTAYGVVALALVFVALCQVFIDVGFTEGIVQKRDISNTTLSSVFILNITLSIILGVLIVIFAPFIGEFFDNNAVVDVIRYLALILPISALGKVHSAILTKELRIKSLSIRDIVSSFVGGAVGIYTAYAGFGVYSLVWQQISTAILSTVLLWMGSRWVPQLLFSWKEVKPVLVFSFYVFLDYLMQQFFNRLDTLFVGKVFSPAMLGLYSRANSLTSLTNDLSTNTLSKVIFPVFSNLQQDREKLKEVFSKTIAFTLITTTLLSGVMFFASEAIIIGLLGEKWRKSIEFFQILIFLSISLPLRAIVFKAILAMGYSRLRLKVNVLSNIVKLMSIPVGYFFGIEAFAWAVVAGRFVIVVIAWMAFKTIISFDVKSTLKPIIMPVSILAFWTGLYYMHLFQINMLYYGVLFVVTFIGLLHITNNYGYRLVIEEFVKVVKKLRKKKGAAKTPKS